MSIGPFAKHSRSLARGLACSRCSINTSEQRNTSHETPLPQGIVSSEDQRGRSFCLVGGEGLRLSERDARGARRWLGRAEHDRGRGSRHGSGGAWRGDQKDRQEATLGHKRHDPLIIGDFHEGFRRTRGSHGRRAGRWWRLWLSCLDRKLLGSAG